MEIKNKRVLVTGGNGFLGRHLVNRLEAMGAVVFAPSSAELDFRSTAETLNFFASHQPQDVFHAAARVGGIGYNQDNGASILIDNLEMNTNIFRTCRMFDVEKLITVGSVCAYPENTPVPFVETELWNGYPEPTNAPYGISKLVLAELCKSYHEQYGMNAIHLILANMYGRGDTFDPRKSHVIPALIRKFHEAKVSNAPSVELWGTGEATRDFLFVSDAVNALIAAAEKYDSPEPINIGTGIETSIVDVAIRIKAVVGYTGEMVWSSVKPNGQLRRVLATSRAIALLGCERPLALSDGLRMVYRHYLASVEDTLSG